MSAQPSILNLLSVDVQAAFQAKDITSDAMRQAIGDWYGLYYNKERTEKEDPCQQIPFTIVRKLTKTTFSEYTASAKDDFTKGVLKALDKKKKTAMQKSLIGGECLLKPVPTADGFRFGVVDRRSFLVFGRDSDGRMTDIGTSEVTAKGQYYYTLLERRTVGVGGYLTIRNSLYRSTTSGILGQRVGLQSLPEYAELPEEYTFTVPIGSIGMATIRTPVENCVDGSHDAVSVYAAATGVIHNINENEAQMDGEFDRGESRILVSADMLKRDKNGRRSFTDHVFTGLDDDPDTVGINIFSPALREQSFLNRKQEYLRNVESIIGLKRGLLSEVEAADRTATEITSSEGDYNLTIIDFQDVWEEAVKEAARICGIFGQLYKVPGAHEVDLDSIAIEWGNGVLYDDEAAWTDKKDQVARGLLKPEIAVGWRYGMPYETEAQRKKIREQYMPDVLDESGEDE